MSGWIRTFTGARFWPADPRPHDISIIDIAHHLSMIPRFTGALREFYSVAQHCLMVEYLAPQEDKLWALLHDASEAYTSDVSKPLKASLPDFQAVEQNIMKAVAQRFSLPWPMPCSIKKADMIALVSEANRHLSMGTTGWPDFGVEPFPEYHWILDPLSPGEAKARFLAAFDHLDKLRLKAESK